MKIHFRFIAISVFSCLLNNSEFVFVKAWEFPWQAQAVYLFVSILPQAFFYPIQYGILINLQTASLCFLKDKERQKQCLLFNFLALFVPMIAFLLTSAVCIQQTNNSARSHNNSLCFSQHCSAAVLFLKCIYPEKTEHCFSHIAYLHLGDAPYGAPLSRCTGAVGGWRPCSRAPN